MIADLRKTTCDKCGKESIMELKEAGEELFASDNWVRVRFEYNICDSIQFDFCSNKCALEFLHTLKKIPAIKGKK